MILLLLVLHTLLQYNITRGEARDARGVPSREGEALPQGGRGQAVALRDNNTTTITITTTTTNNNNNNNDNDNNNQGLQGYGFHLSMSHFEIL